MLKSKARESTFLQDAISDSCSDAAGGSSTVKSKTRSMEKRPLLSLSSLTDTSLFGVLITSYFVFSSSCAAALSRIILMVISLVLAISFMLYGKKHMYQSLAPPGFPLSGNGMWYDKPGSVWAKEFLPIGNGFLGAMLPGGTREERTQLNMESLWTGGPFSDHNYNGGNKLTSERTALAKKTENIRQKIFQSPVGEIDNIMELTSPAGAYGSYVGAGHLVTTLKLNGKSSLNKYARWLDLDEGVVRSRWTEEESTFFRESFCSHPTKACLQYLTAFGHLLPITQYKFSPSPDLPIPNITCLDNNTLSIRGHASHPGMLYELIGRAHSEGGSVACVSVGARGPSLIVEGSKKIWIIWVGGTEYDMDAGDAAHGFSFRGPDPHSSLLALLGEASMTPYENLLAEHVVDLRAALGSFSLDLGQKAVLNRPTNVLKEVYGRNRSGRRGNSGDGRIVDRYVEWVLFNYGRYLLASGARGVLPVNLQGKWAVGGKSAWGADYHSNVNLQMNYWAAEMMGVGRRVMGPLFDYFEKTLAPRGARTAQVLYNISRGWVTHNEMNIFGHTGMKLDGNSASWANYPESAVWVMVHVWDHFDYSNDIKWWRAQGWPLVKGVASFHLDKLIPDLHFNDSMLVVSPCNSPEQRPITFGCAHAQQLIWQLFNSVEKGFEVSGDTDIGFLEEVKAKRRQMDKGIHIGLWGQLQEWKVDKDRMDDSHRHLSHLIGLYPGYAVTNYNPEIQGNSVSKYTKGSVLRAAEISLFHRGNGTGQDADAGWGKVWRAACWAELGNADEFYHVLSYGIRVNFGPNLLSLYDPTSRNAIFQIDANLAYPAALLNALVQAPDVASFSIPLTVKLLPALPKKWPSGKINGVRIRGGITLDLQWAGRQARKATFRIDKNAKLRVVRVSYRSKVVKSFKTIAGLTVVITF